ncbi:MAG TPA: CcmD family protein [Chitinophagales bacterium]|nr:CcmD family protein [Chitinophagales bacterium]HRH54713.1 CcmD family protein [Chitinophagales bacterium]
MKKAKSYIQKLISFFFLMATITFAHAQKAEADANGNVVDNVLRSNGLIYVVVGVVVIILAGLIFYLTTIDRKLSKLEKEIKNK